jgi:hypothetical protein
VNREQVAVESNGLKEEEASLLAARFSQKASSKLGFDETRRVSDEQYFAELGYTVAGIGDERRFAAAIEPLEARVGRRMNGPGRASCVRAFTREPERVSSVIAEVLSRLEGVGFSDIRSPLGLVVKMVADGDDYRTPEGEAKLGAGPCPLCEVGGGAHAIDCPAHGSEA